MSRQLLCLDCAERKLPEGTRLITKASAETGEPAEYARLVMGRARPPAPQNRWFSVNNKRFPLSLAQWECDICGKAIYAGERCGCRSIWVQGQPAIPAWEAEYLEKEK